LFIKYVFAQAFELDEAGWRKLTIRWGIFFLALALLNEMVWRATSTETWVAFKVWAIIPLLFLFALAQTPLVMKHQQPDKSAQQ
jgi:intracellular septation protein